MTITAQERSAGVAPKDTFYPIGNILRYGAVGDGVTDNYQAFLDLSLVTNEYGGGNLVFPPGHYLIDQVRNVDENGQNQNGSTIENITYRDCLGLRVSGYGAKIDCKGDVVADDDWNGSSDTKMVIPFRLEKCSRVQIEGFELNGNVDLLAGTVTSEGDNHLIALLGCRNVVIRDVHAHHAWTDNVHISRNQEGDRNQTTRGVTIENCELSYAGRCNVGLIESRFVAIRGGSLHHGGNHAGEINFSPRCNLNWEPNLSAPGDTFDAGFHADKPVVPGQSAEVDVSSLMLTLDSLELYGAGLRNVVCVRKAGGIAIRQCFLDNESNDNQPIGLDVPLVILEGNHIDVRGGRLDLALTGGVDGVGTVRVSDNEIHARAKPDGTRGQALFFDGDKGFQTRVVIERNRFIDDSTVPRSSNFIYMSHADGREGAPLWIKFAENYVFMPSAAHDGSGQHIASTMHVHLSENNVWQTDLDSTSKFFAAYYIAENAAPDYQVRVRNDRFIAKGVKGSLQGFRPADNSNWDNNQPFEMG